MRPSRLSVLAVPIVLTIAAVLPTTGWGAERCVLGELFTATWWSTCATAGPVVSDLMDSYPTTFAVYQMHVSDPPYNTDWADTRRLFYGNIADGIPWFAYDGLFDAWPISNYHSNLTMRQAVPTDVTIDLFGTESGAQTYDIVAEVCIEPGGVDKTMRVYMVDALDHWPPSPSYERNTCRQGTTTEDVVVTAGSCATVTRTFTFDAISWAQQNDIKIVAWAQTPATQYPAEVHQAKVMHWPFTPYTTIFSDDFETGTTDGWSAVLP